jgi:cell volume regulation protein A
VVHLPIALVITVGVLVASVPAAAFADRLGAPALLLFLGFGVLLGEDGPGGIRFEDARLARDIGIAALVVILLEGGFSADARDMRRAAAPGALLATVGVAVTAVVVGLAAHVLVDLPLSAALLLGAIVSSTDAAAVLTAVRRLPLRRRLRAVLEVESGINDPVAAMLVIGLVEAAQGTGRDVTGWLGLLVAQLAVGVLGGLVLARVVGAVARRLPLPAAGLYPVWALAGTLGAYVVVTAAHGSGLAAAYIVGLRLAAERLPAADAIGAFLEGIAWLAQIGLFVLLGLLVTPSELFQRGGVEPLVVAGVLVLIARPLAVAASLAPFATPWREQAFLAWAGLRGGVPIVFATFPVVAGLRAGTAIFNVVFYVVVVSVFVQGLTLRAAAARLGVADERPRLRLADLTATTLHRLGADLVQLEARRLGVERARAIRDLELPDGVVISAVIRGSEVIAPRGDTELLPGDTLYLLVEHAARDRLADAFA